MVDELNRELERDFPGARLGWTGAGPARGMSGAGSAVGAEMQKAGSARPPGVVDQLANVMADLDQLNMMLIDLSMHLTSSCPPAQKNEVNVRGPHPDAPSPSGVLTMVAVISSKMRSQLLMGAEIVRHIREVAS